MTTTSGNEPPVNIIKVKKKPGPSSSPPKQQSQPPQPAPASPPATGKKRKRIAVLSGTALKNIRIRNAFIHVILPMISGSFYILLLLSMFGFVFFFTIDKV